MLCAVETGSFDTAQELQSCESVREYDDLDSLPVNL